MYSSKDFERLFIRYKGEAYPRSKASKHSAIGTMSSTAYLGNLLQMRCKSVIVPH